MSELGLVLLMLSSTIALYLVTELSMKDSFKINSYILIVITILLNMLINTFNLVNSLSKIDSTKNCSCQLIVK